MYMKYACSWLDTRKRAQSQSDQVRGSANGDVGLSLRPILRLVVTVDESPQSSLTPLLRGVVTAVES